ncbi:hypothetical protein C2S51_007816 [Perilla frutescens var. frutescens]|nr:hypothetical protein C2S51_007816 [Perilla frutescens var. frutescens]
MAEGKHHHLFNRHKEEEETVDAVTYSETAYRVDGPGQFYENTEAISYASVDKKNDYEKYEEEEKHHKKKEHLGEMGAMAAGAFALYEKHEAKKDPENKHRHKIEEEVAAAAAVGAGGFAFHEHHDKKEAKEEEERAEGKKHHHLF